MNIRNVGLQILGLLAVVAGGILALMLLWALVAGHTANPWMLFGDLLFAAVAAYLIYIGRRAIYSAKGKPRTAARFGWGRMLLGAVVIFGQANSHFHFFPVREVVKPLEPENPTQAQAMNATIIAVCIGCAFLIWSGIWRGLRPDTVRQGSAE